MPDKNSFKSTPVITYLSNDAVVAVWTNYIKVFKKKMSSVCFPWFLP